jgi:superfamily II RNA helicase
VKDYSTQSTLNLQDIFPFKLDGFQKQAIAALDAGKSVVVCAPTGSGKTLIGEYAIYRALSRGKRVFYTTPLKALSNQKFRDFQERFGQLAASDSLPEVGLITGDTVIYPEAPIVVMTTEIFRNMLYETPIGQVGTSLEAVETVVLDECHYISDRGRGTVWEESIIYCPPSIQLVALSATIGNPEELTDWIDRVHSPRSAQSDRQKAIATCELINSDFRPVPLRFYFSNKNGLLPLLNQKQTQVNPRLKGKPTKGNRRGYRREDCPRIATVIEQLQEKEMLPAIYVIFSRRGCDQAVQELEGLTLVSESEARALHYHLLTFLLADNPELQERLLSACAQEIPTLHPQLFALLAAHANAEQQLLDVLAAQPEAKARLFQILGENSALARADQLEPLTRGIAAHHAGSLPIWKELVETLFEMGLIKVVFATATLSAGINMPARTAVISALSKRTEEGHSMLTPSEFLQIAGRAGRRGMDKVGHVVAVQTPFEGALEAAYLATAKAEPLRSCFTPSYGMVLNLLQKHSLSEAKDLLERSFAEYLAKLKLVPEQETIARLTTALAKLDVELAGIDAAQFASYEKLKERLRSEQHLLKILQHQAESARKYAIALLLDDLLPGSIVHLKGKHVKVADPLTAVAVARIPGSGQAPDLICLGEDNRWYIVPHSDIVEINPKALPRQVIAALTVPEFDKVQLGAWRKGDHDTERVRRQLRESAAPLPIAPEVREQEQRCEQVQASLDRHPLQQRKNPGHLIKLHYHRLDLREELYRSQSKYQKQQAHKSYYWQEFLNLIEILREFKALDGYIPTSLGEAAATIRSENELWLGLVLTSGAFESLAPHQLAAAVSALITETLRPDTWTNYPPPTEAIEAFRRSTPQRSSLRELRRQLYQLQSRYEITIPVWLETQLLGLVEQWALGTDWDELCNNTNLDEGDLVRLLRRTIDILWQLPQIPRLTPSLQDKARAAIQMMKRFPI